MDCARGCGVLPGPGDLYPKTSAMTGASRQQRREARFACADNDKPLPFPEEPVAHQTVQDTATAAPQLTTGDLIVYGMIFAIRSAYVRVWLVRIAEHTTWCN